MKALIMAGGYATRLWPITKSKPKPLLPLGEKTIIEYILEKVKETGLPTYISTNKFFESHFRPLSDKYNIELIVENTYKEEEKLGTIGAIKNAIDVLGEDDYLIVAGDNVFSLSLLDFVRRFNELKKTLIAVYDVGDLELAKRYGIVILEGDRVIYFEEKPSSPKTSLISTGIYAFPKNVITRVEEYLKKGNKDAPGYFIQWLLESKTEIYGYKFGGYWYDIGSADSYLEAFKIFLKESYIEEIQISPYAKIIPPVVIRRGARILGRSIIGPYAYIDEECIIENSDISDSIIFRDTIIRNSTIWRSIIDEKCEIRNLELRKSLVGGHAKIQRGD
ncbi:glucose-1-phosphate thymidylyltransferase [Thermococcus chitonophagus]|uniref:Bifunctional protein GlmU n=1 Tax=Thermococcus chitonophagus TaxID=54262 RepID=A0A160VSR8_9EURY|nr:NDP-sugar synthase [Thermococcus chitonophagus]ASJ17311.1 glucose-1-phosphate thymidylyltransferase [Thermococcus chitonophagus]CUX77942.1 Glucose-1-phosphate thymidylyltransferase [Thermococcus chitonophagus]